MEISLIVLAVICVVLAALLYNTRIISDRLQNDISELMLSNNHLKEENVRLEGRVEYAERMAAQTRAEADRRANDSLRQSRELIDRSEERFRLLANELLTVQTSRMTQNNEDGINRLLNPLKEDIEKFRRDVTTFYSKESAERFSLQERIKELVQTNINIGKEARELSSALRGNSKVQGDWGEIVLETILENSGLRKGEEFEVQVMRDKTGTLLRNDEGSSLRPDVIVKYPEGKVMIIDSKVSLTAFVEYVNSETDSERERYGRLHLASIERHVEELNRKSYQDYVGRQKLDFVMMFIPNESAYSAAMTLDPQLWQKAYDKRVLIVSPTQLVASLKIVSQLWIHDRQARNAIEIAERSGAMYDKFVGFVSDMEKIERGLATTQSAYDAAMRKLRDGTGSLIVRAEKLRELGVKATKRLPETSD